MYLIKTIKKTNIGPKIKIAIIGLGYVGLPLAVAFGNKYPTLGFDINTSRVSDLTQGIDRTLESDKDKIKGATHLTFSSAVEDLKKWKKLVQCLAKEIRRISSELAFCRSMALP